MRKLHKISNTISNFTWYAKDIFDSTIVKSEIPLLIIMPYMKAKKEMHECAFRI